MLFLLLLAVPMVAAAQSDSAIKVLIVNAHPDDESAMAATVYKITHDLGGKVDLLLVTNGEGGYKYSTLAESIYGVELTDESVGREHLPAIRKRETMNAGRWIGIRNYFFLDNKDHMYTTNVDTVLRHVWDVAAIKRRIQEVIIAGGYDYIFCLLPTEETHGHHKGSTILALEAVRDLPRGVKRPVVLGASVSGKNDTTSFRFTGLKGYPLTSVRSGMPLAQFDRTQKFGYRDRLDYRIVVNWLIAEHKSQGTMQMLINQGDIENFWFFDMNDPAAAQWTSSLFAQLVGNRFEKKEY